MCMCICVGRAVRQTVRENLDCDTSSSLLKCLLLQNSFLLRHTTRCYSCAPIAPQGLSLSLLSGSEVEFQNATAHIPRTFWLRSLRTRAKSWAEQSSKNRSTSSELSSNSLKLLAFILFKIFCYPYLASFFSINTLIIINEKLLPNYKIESFLL